MAQGDPPVYQLVDSDGNVQAEIRHDLAESLIIDQLQGNNIDFQNSELSNIASMSTEVAEATELQRLKINQRNLEQWTSIGRQIDNFEDLSDWTVFDGTAEAGEDYFHRGSQSMKLESGEDDRARVYKDFNIDLTKWRPAIAVRAHYPDDEGEYKWRGFRVECRDDDNDSVVFRTNYRTFSDGNQKFRFYQPPIHEIDDGVDVENITRIWIEGGDGETWWFDALRFTPVPENGRIMIDFDTGSDADEINDYALELMSEYGFPARVASRAAHVDDDGWDALEQAREKYGWLAGPHRYDDGPMNELDKDEIRKDLEDAKREYVKRGHQVGSLHRSLFQNRTTQDALDIGQEYYLTMRQGGDVGGHGVPVNPMLLPCRSMDDGLTTDLEDKLEFIAENGGYGRLYGHPDDRLGASDLDDILSKLKTLEEDEGLRVISIEKAYKEWVGHTW